MGKKDGGIASHSNRDLKLTNWEFRQRERWIRNAQIEENDSDTPEPRRLKGSNFCYTKLDAYTKEEKRQNPFLRKVNKMFKI